MSKRGKPRLPGEGWKESGKEAAIAAKSQVLLRRARQEGFAEGQRADADVRLALLLLFYEVGSAATLAVLAANMPRRDIQEALQTSVRRAMANLHDRFFKLQALLGTVPEEVEQPVMQLHAALAEWNSGVDNREHLLNCGLVRSGMTTALAAALGDLRVGGAPESPAYAWLGEAVTRARHRPEIKSDREAIKLVYGELLRHEREGVLYDPEREALSNLESSDGRLFRDKRLLSPRAFNYARRAASDWRKRNPTRSGE